MPAGDGTGPRGIGPISGKAAGYCVEQQAPGYARPGCDSGMGRNFGRGRGKCYRCGITGIAPAATREQGLEALKRQVKQSADNYYLCERIV
jgi:hypothetical protein